MKVFRTFGSSSNWFRAKLRSSSTGAGLTGLSSSSTGLILSVQADVEATPTVYTVAGSTIESITTLGTFVAPTSTKIRFKEVDSTNSKGDYEFQIADARFNVANSRTLKVNWTGATGLLDSGFEIQLGGFQIDSVTPNINLVAINGGNASSVTDGPNQYLKCDLKSILGTLLTETPGQIAAAFKQFYNVASPAATMEGLTTLLARITSTRAGYFDNLNSGGVVATAAALANIQNNTFIGTNIPTMLERPDASSVSVPLVVIFNDETGSPADIDSSALPTVALTNNAGTDLSSRLSSWTHAATGKYTATYTNTSTDAIDDLHWEITATVNTKARRYPAMTQIVDTTAVSFTSTDRSNLAAIKTQTDQFVFTIAGQVNATSVSVSDKTGYSLTQAFPTNFSSLGIGATGHLLNVDTIAGSVQAFNLAGSVQSVSGAVGSVTGSVGGNVNGSTNTIGSTGLSAIENRLLDATAASHVGAGTIGALLASIKTDTGTLLTNLATLAAKFTGITLLANWMRAARRKTNNDATAVAEINADNGSGTGSFDPTTDSEQAISDAVAAGGGSGGSGDWTPTEKSEIRYRLGIDGATAVPATNGVHLDLVNVVVTINSVVDVTDGNRLNLVRGDDHTEGDRLPSWTILNYTGPSMVGGSLKLRLLREDIYTRKDSHDEAILEVNGTISQSGSTLTITGPITSTESAELLSTPTPGFDTHEYQLLGITLAGHPHSILFGPTTVLRSIEAAS
jgi:hypothetical protein